MLHRNVRRYINVIGLHSKYVNVLRLPYYLHQFALEKNPEKFLITVSLAIVCCFFLDEEGKQKFDSWWFLKGLVSATTMNRKKKLKLTRTECGSEKVISEVDELKNLKLRQNQLKSLIKRQILPMPPDIES
ncbi:CLUMA_CG020548, isoform A [Clunio marinus]|uniref:CLUMA_CG020548, isoform A n=1 Tax=Clunio marinus TaxID=568069 RepID=A0A1J1J5B7_9DIPT|nr:CLUMA_CG020548, isoform A [Clunio marinus]